MYVVLCYNIFVIEMLEMLKRYLNIISENFIGTSCATKNDEFPKSILQLIRQDLSAPNL